MQKSGIYHKVLILTSLLFYILSPLATAATPDHVVIMVFDAMRPDFIDRFNLPHFKKLRALSQNYQNAYLGYIGAETSVSHLVLPTGKQPRELPWQDDIFYDAKGALGPVGQFYATGGLSIDQLRGLMKNIPNDNTLPAQLKKILGGSGKVFAVGEKNYATTALGTLSADAIITLRKQNGRCIPDGIRVPSYISENERFKLECSKKYGTDNTFYSLDGAKSVPGDDPKHLGGDIWVADVAFEVMKNENWSTLLLTFAGIDKVMHMLGEVDANYTPPQVKSVKTEFHLEKIASLADEQLGKILDELERRHLLERTLVVVTADHGCQVDKNYLGNGKTSKWGTLKNESDEEAPKWVRHFTQSGEVLFSYQDTAIRTWLKSRSSDRKPVIKAMSEVPGVTEIFELVKNHGAYSYQRDFSVLDQQPAKFRAWANAHSSEILNATATANSPDLIGLLADETGFDLIGDHGGAQENVQRIPLMIFNPSKPAGVVRNPLRMDQLKNEVLRALTQSP